MELEVSSIPTIRDIEKSVLDLSSKIRIQSTYLDCHIEKMEEDGNLESIMSESEAEKVLERTKSLKDELEKFKLNLKKFQELTKQKRNSSESKDDVDKTEENCPEIKTDESTENMCSPIAHPESLSAESPSKIQNDDAQENEDRSTTMTTSEIENTETDHE